MATPAEDEDLSECMTTVILEADDNWAEIANLPYVPDSYSEGIPWDDANVTDLATDGSPTRATRFAPTGTS